MLKLMKKFEPILYLIENNRDPNQKNLQVIEFMALEAK